MTKSDSYTGGPEWRQRNGQPLHPSFLQHGTWKTDFELGKYDARTIKVSLNSVMRKKIVALTNIASNLA